MPDFRACVRVNIENNSGFITKWNLSKTQTIEMIEMIENYPFPKTVIKTRKHL